MQKHDFEAQLSQARVLTDAELLQAQGGNFVDYVGDFLRPIVHPVVIGKPWGGAFGTLVHRAWDAVKQAV